MKHMGPVKADDNSGEADQGQEAPLPTNITY